MKVENIPITSIKPYWRNPRKNESAVQAVVQSIKDYGFNNPLLLDKENVIIAGHTRYKALLELGMKEAPCIIVDLPAAKVKEYRIADNKTSELSEWDFENLIPELREISDLPNFQTYFPEDDLEKLIADSRNFTSNFKGPSDEDIEERTGELSKAFEGVVNNVEKDMVEVACPSCNTKFFLSIRELVKELEVTTDAEKFRKESAQEH